MDRVSVRSHPTLQTKLASYQCQNFVSLSWFLNPAGKLTDGKLGLEDPEDCSQEPTASLLHRTGKEWYQGGDNKVFTTFYTKNHFHSSQHFYSTYVQGRQLSTSSYEFIKTDLAGTENRWSRVLAKYHSVSNVLLYRVGVVTLNRPKALNALCAGLMDELIRCIFFNFSCLTRLITLLKYVEHK